MRFLAGMAVGIVIGRPALRALDMYLPDAVHSKLVNGLQSLADRINQYADSLGAPQEDS